MAKENALKELKELEVTFGYHERLRAKRDIRSGRAWGFVDSGLYGGW
jgi:hypothetical protein